MEVPELKIDINDDIFKKLYVNIRKAAKNSDTYKKLTKRKYRPVDGYEDWLDIMVEFAVALNGAAAGIKTLQLNPLLMLTVELVNNYIVKKSSTYWLNKDLANTLKSCDIPDGINELPSTIPHGLILLPSEYAPIDDEGDPINWILFSKMKAGEQFPAILVGKRYVLPEPIEKDCILWVSQTKETTLYSGAITTEFKYHAITPTGITPTQSERVIIQEISNLLLQSLLISQWYPEYTEVESGTGFSNQKVHRSTKKENTWLNPKWIGDLYKKSSNPRKPHQGGTHESPFRHTRRGHWRNQAYGPKWSEHRMILIESAEVNKEL